MYDNTFNRTTVTVDKVLQILLHMSGRETLLCDECKRVLGPKASLLTSQPPMSRV